MSLFASASSIYTIKVAFQFVVSLMLPCSVFTIKVSQPTLLILSFLIIHRIFSFTYLSKPFFSYVQHLVSVFRNSQPILLSSFSTILIIYLYLISFSRQITTLFSLIFLHIFISSFFILIAFELINSFFPTFISQILAVFNDVFQVALSAIYLFIFFSSIPLTFSVVFNHLSFFFLS